MSTHMHMSTKYVSNIYIPHTLENVAQLSVPKLRIRVEVVD